MVCASLLRGILEVDDQIPHLHGNQRGPAALPQRALSLFPAVGVEPEWRTPGDISHAPSSELPRAIVQVTSCPFADLVIG